MFVIRENVVSDQFPGGLLYENPEMSRMETIIKESLPKYTEDSSSTEIYTYVC